ncbi:MAG: D-glycero-beta-D-manno-heptose 1-phosphate adenylyltransferase [Proteobacteria bacterium]|nr:D-glycero-beta-D-manno-heptose 1-phosphate adenylyltransferase [Pseudomonadota bacterium]
MNHQTTAPERPSLHEILARACDLAVWVVGDIMLDEYVIGDVARISPEAPVPVVRVQRFEDRLGGAANVACQVGALGAQVALAGLVGNDVAGGRVLDLCRESGIDVRAVRQLTGRPTSRKLRTLARNQQLVRLDWEDTAPCPADAIDWMLERLREVRAPDVVILSDYAKGVLTPALIGRIREIAASANTRIVVDPKQRDFDAYRGASILTPNLHELEVAAGRTFDPEDAASIAECAQWLARDIGAEALVVKRGGRGMLVAPARGPHQVIPARGRALFDPTGAGDTVVALLATVLAAEATLVEAATLANAAAGITVGKVGTVSVTPGEIVEFLGGESDHKVLDRDELMAQVGHWRNAGKRIVFTNGCFDLLHAGHLSLLHQAAQHGDVLVVAVNSDDSVRRLKGTERPLVSEHERAAMLAALGCVDAVTIFAEDTPLELLQAIRPDILVKGGDYRVEQVVGRELVESAGGRVVLVPLLSGKSTTALIDRIVNRGPAR